MPDQTWDGVQIASDDPIGCTVVVRRAGAAEPEYLLLHRNAHGTAFEGDWAWTPPAGCRQPGESVYPAALRELHEEAGLRDVRPWMAGRSQRPGGRPWVVFGLDVPADADVELIDPEHDRFEWVTAAEAVRRVRPAFVAEHTVTRVARTPSVSTGFRPMTYDDLPQVLGWQLAPHAARWWAPDGERDLAELRDRYGPRLDGEEPVRMWVMEVDGRDVGYLQDYPVSLQPDYAAKTTYPDAVAFDYLLGDESLTGRGLGTRIVWEYLRDVVRPAHPDVTHLLASPDERNVPSLRLLSACGFDERHGIQVAPQPGAAPVTEVVHTLDVAHWFGR